jgi:hypothetical protein
MASYLRREFLELVLLRLSVIVRSRGRSVKIAAA